MSEWIEKEDHLYREFEFKNFSEAWSFISRVALLAEQHQHHPKWTNIYNKVSIELNTHDAGNTITEKDRKLANDISKLL